MAREHEGYRRQLEDILEFSHGARLLTIGDVRKYTGISDYRTLKRRFPFDGHYISAMTLAHVMCRGEVEK